MAQQLDGGSGVPLMFHKRRREKTLGVNKFVTFSCLFAFMKRSFVIVVGAFSTAPQCETEVMGWMANMLHGALFFSACLCCHHNYRVMKLKIYVIAEAKTQQHRV